MATTISNGESGSSVRTKLNNIWEGLQINEIASTIADTAVDIFVYDTRKDSDGGAWRKRTQHTSWYNETLNTATRGSRKEFPAVAVIVAENGQVTIYDGDDPALPMWMVFNASNNAMIKSSSINSISIANGEMYVGMVANADLQYISFIRDTARWITASTAYGGFYKQGGIDKRNDTSAFGYYNNVAGISDITIVNSTINDVAMTVLPNAPIDAATGLPVPTIAVATDGGHSFILDNGNVVDLLTTTYTDTDHVSFTDKGRTYNLFNAGGFVSINELPSADISTGSSLGGGDRLTKTASPAFSPNFSSSGTDIVAKSYDEAAISTGAGLTNLQYTGDTTTSMVAYTTSDYATGWMNGDIKLATLSDTDATNVTGSELVDQTASGWTLPTGYSHDGSGALSYDGTGVRYTKPYDSFTVEAGKLYVLSFNLSAASPEALGLCSVWVNTSTSTPSAGTSYEASRVNPDSTGLYTSTFYADTNGGTVYFTVQNNLADATQTFTIEDISVRLAEEDRSVNG